MLYELETLTGNINLGEPENIVFTRWIGHQ